MGGPVAITFLRLFPARTKALVMVDAFVPRAPKDDADRANQKARWSPSFVPSASQPTRRRRKKRSRRSSRTRPRRPRRTASGSSDRNASTPYSKSQSKKLYCRDPAYRLTSDLHSPVKQLLQIYFDRWQIQVNHREEKDTLGAGQAQLRDVTSVPKQPVLAVAANSALLLAALQPRLPPHKTTQLSAPTPSSSLRRGPASGSR